MSLSKYILFDTETTGLKKEDRIIQVGSIITDKNKSIEVFDELCYTDIPISEEASEVNGITFKDIQDKNLFIETEFYKRLESLNNETNYLIAHNMPFDLGMIEKEGFDAKIKLIDTRRVARKVLKSLDSYSLQDLRYSLELDKLEKSESEKFNIELRAHEALSDVIIMKLLFEKLIEIIKEEYPNIDPIEKMYLITKTPILIEKFEFGKHKGKKISDVYEQNPSYINWFLQQDSLDMDLEYTFKQVKKYTSKNDLKPNVGEKLKYGPYSYSRIGCYQNCARAFKYQYIDEIEVAQEDQVPIKAFEKGSYLHSLLESAIIEINVNNNLLALNDMDDLTLFKTKYQDKIEYPINFMNDINEFDNIFLNFVKSEHFKRIITDYDEYYPESYSEINLSEEKKDDNLLFRGYIDLKTKKDKHVGIIDWKSGRTNRYDGIQLGNYALSEMIKDPSINKVTVFYALIEQNNNEVFTFVKDSIEEVEKLNDPEIRSIDEIVHWMERNINKIENETKWETNPEANCYWCDFKNHCEKENSFKGTL